MSLDIVTKSNVERVSVTHVLSADERAEAEGFVAEKIQRLVPDVMERDVYVCGPPAMIDAVVAVVLGLGVPRARVHYASWPKRPWREDCYRRLLVRFLI